MTETGAQKARGRPPGEVEAECRVAEAAIERRDFLSLSGCGLRQLPPGVAQLSKLRRLDVSDNRLTNLGPEILALAALEQLDLGGNRIASLPPDVSRLTRLSSLDVSENRLTDLPPEFGALARLVELSLYGNRLERLPEALRSLSGLERLDLAANRLVSPSSVAGLSRLTVLDMSANLLTAVPDGLAELGALQRLDLSRNAIAAGAVPAVEVLDLSGNPLADALGSRQPEPALEMEQAAAAEALRGSIIGGPQPGQKNFEAVPYLFSAWVAVGGFAGAVVLIDRFYRHFTDTAQVELKFPHGTVLFLGRMSRRRALEIARQHEAELAAGSARLDLGQTAGGEDTGRKIALAVDALTHVPGAALETHGGRTGHQTFVINGPVNIPVIQAAYFKTTIGDEITIGSIQGSTVNVKSSLTNTTQTIGSTPTYDHK